MKRSFSTALVVALAAGRLAAQEAPAGRPAPAAPGPATSPDSAPPEGGEETEIVVTGGRARGAVIGDIPPDRTISPAEIRSFGVSSVAGLLAELAPQTGSVRGRGGDAPVTLVNGRRVSSFAEIRDIPTEAILRVDILPEEVALKYGYSANQRVVNFVLRPRFRAYTSEATDRFTTAGGANNYSGEATYLRINRDRRVNLALNYQATEALFEDERDIVSTGGSRGFDLIGNVRSPVRGARVDPALDALAGQTVTVAGAPAAAASGRATLGGFVPGANRANVTDQTAFRTLVPQSRSFSANGVVNRNVFGTVSATLNGSFGATDSSARQGLPGVSLLVPAGTAFSPFGTDVVVDRATTQLGALRQDISGETGHLGLTLDKDLARWRLSLTGNYDYATTRTATETGLDPAALQAAVTAGTLNPFGPLGSLATLRSADRATATSHSGNAQLVVSGPLLAVPAGDVSTTVKVGASALGFTSRSTRLGVDAAGSVDRSDISAQINLDMPLTSRRNGILAGIGDVSLNANAAVDRLSDFGALTTLGGGVNWKPIAPVSLIVSYTSEEGAPSPQQLGNPQVVTPNVRVFDYRTGTTVDVTRIDGGNPALRADNRRVTKLGLTVKPLAKAELTLSANYASSRIRNAIAGFPSGTSSPEIEAAFPGRFVRDTSGQLLSFDSRPVNFARDDRDDLRLGIDFSQPLKLSAARQAEFEKLRAARIAAGGGQGRPGGPGGDRPRGPGGEGGPGGGGGGGRGGGGGFGGGRLQLAVFYTAHLRSEVTIAPGVPVLDLLNGSATGSSGGQPRHEVEVQAGVNKNGLGARLSANYASGTIVDGGSVPANDLSFSPLTTVNLRLFADLGQQPALVKRARWVRGMRLSLNVNNLFDSRLRVRDGTGATPLSYQPDLLNPFGRAIRVSVRKLFF